MWYNKQGEGVRSLPLLKEGYYEKKCVFYIATRCGRNAGANGREGDGREPVNDDHDSYFTCIWG